MSDDQRRNIGMPSWLRHNVYALSLGGWPVRHLGQLDCDPHEAMALAASRWPGKIAVAVQGEPHDRLLRKQLGLPLAWRQAGMVAHG